MGLFGFKRAQVIGLWDLRPHLGGTWDVDGYRVFGVSRLGIVVLVSGRCLRFNLATWTHRDRVGRSPLSRWRPLSSSPFGTIGGLFGFWGLEGYLEARKTP